MQRLCEGKNQSLITHKKQAAVEATRRPPAYTSVTHLNRAAPVWECRRPSCVSSASSSSEARTASERASSAHWRLCRSRPLQQTCEESLLGGDRGGRSMAPVAASLPREARGANTGKFDTWTKTADGDGGRNKNWASFTAAHIGAVRLGRAVKVILPTEGILLPAAVQLCSVLVFWLPLTTDYVCHVRTGQAFGHHSNR